MREVCIVPSWKRPEFLYLALEHIKRATQMPVWVFCDRGGMISEIASVCNTFNAFFYLREPHFFQGNSYNVLSAYKTAALEHDRIFMVEEDVLVTKDFFDWHNAVHDSEPDILASVGHRNLSLAKYTDNLTVYALSATEYASLGVCWKREALQLVLEHAQNAYFSNMLGYVKRTFPKSRLDGIWCEQDGLIRRVQESTGKLVAFPHVPRAYHLGWYGYNRTDSHRPSGTLEQRVEALRKFVYSADALRAVPNPYHDIEAYKEVEPWPYVIAETL